MNKCPFIANQKWLRFNSWILHKQTVPLRVKSCSCIKWISGTISLNATINSSCTSAINMKIVRTVLVKLSDSSSVQKTFSVDSKKVLLLSHSQWNHISLPVYNILKVWDYWQSIKIWFRQHVFTQFPQFVKKWLNLVAMWINTTATPHSMPIINLVVSNLS